MQNSDIFGVKFVRPVLNPDRRGSLDVIFSGEWPDIPAMHQWNIVRSEAGVLRGLHAHSRYDEFYVPIVGRMFIVLKDARRTSPSFGRALGRWIDSGDDYHATLVPAGVVHGVFWATDAVLAYGLSSPWTGEHEFNCRWNDPDIGVDWPVQVPTLSERDAAGGSYADMVKALNAHLVAPT